MDTRDVILAVAGGVAALLSGAVGVAMLIRGRRSPASILWRGQRLLAPRLSACMYLLLALWFAANVVGDLLSEPGSDADGLMLAVSWALFATFLTTAVILWRRRGKQARLPWAQRPGDP